MKKKPRKITGNQKEIEVSRQITYAGREMTEVKNFLGIWYWFYLLD